MRTPTLMLTTALLTLVSIACAQTEPAPGDRRGDLSLPAQAPADDPVGQLIEAINADENGITLDREARTVDIAAKVCLREAEFLEQFACSPDTREHESILVLNAQPSMIHTGMLLLGLEPGSPLTWVEEGDRVRTIAPRGPEVQVFIVTTDDEGEETVVPANTWVKDQKTDEPMVGNTWLFAGSKFVEVNGEEMYVADAYGTAISLVSFGDDLLARAGDLTDQNDSHGKVWGTNTEVIPAVGTEVRVRLVLPAASENPAPAGPESD